MVFVELGGIPATVGGIEAHVAVPQALTPRRERLDVHSTSLSEHLLPTAPST
jgi:hypothetical protein